MKNKHYIIAGFVAYFLLEIIAVSHAYIAGAAIFSNGLTSKMIGMTLALSIMMGVVGCLLGFLFKKFQKYVVGMHIYIQGIIYFLVLGCLFSLFKGVEYIMSIEFVVSQLYSIIAGAIFIFTLNQFSIRRN